VPIGRINKETYLTIGRRSVDNKDKIRTPEVPAKILIIELNTRIREVEKIINSFDNMISMQSA
jgi:hypothetical protein